MMPKCVSSAQTTPWTPDPYIRLPAWYHQEMTQRHLKFNFSEAECLSLPKSSPPGFHISAATGKKKNTLSLGTLAKERKVIPVQSLSLTFPINQQGFVGPTFQVYSESHQFFKLVKTIWKTFWQNLLKPNRLSNSSFR